MDLLIATSNPGKVHEYQILLGDLPVNLRSLRDVGLAGMDVEENGTTLEENATLKAVAYSQASGLYALADDTGLFIDGLNGEPGIYPARYGGPDLTMEQRRAKVLTGLQAVPDAERTARFRCVIALGHPQGGAIQLVDGVVEGHITRIEDDAEGGFGYDPIFVPQGYTQTFSALPIDEKNRISHRGIATRHMLEILRDLIAKQ